MLIVFADSAGNQVPRSGETFDLEDVRKDEECTDTVGIFLRVESGQLFALPSFASDRKCKPSPKR